MRLVRWNHASLVDSKTIRGLSNGRRQAAEVEKVTARMRHLDVWPSEYFGQVFKNSGVTRENEAPSEPVRPTALAGAALVRAHQSPEKGAPGGGRAWDDSAQATYWYNRKTGEASWVDPTQQHLLGTPER